MSANHYHILGVSPDAEDAVIRAAYRALMRMYHPDRNDDPLAQSRARDITAAFEVLGDPERRAAYDATCGDATGLAQPWLAGERGPPPMRNLGIASVGVALALSLAFALPKSSHLAERQAFRSLAAYRDTAQPMPAQRPPAQPSEVVAPLARIVEAPPVIVADPVPAVISEVAQAASPRSTPPPAAPPIAHAPKPTPPPAKSPVVAPIQPPPSARAVERRSQVERLATGFLKQSLEHADWQKQQLLLSARNRSSTSRTLCHSDDCVTEAYLRQIRDTTTIMEGRIPKP